jgi:prolyl oligopeptidase PreP (S9A serine peptidase family)
MSSDGGSDLVEMREFDLESRQFVDNGFRAGPGRFAAAWLDINTPEHGGIALVTWLEHRGSLARSSSGQRWRRTGQCLARGRATKASTEVIR